MRTIVIGCVLALSLGCGGSRETTEEPTPAEETTGDQSGEQAVDGPGGEPATSGTTLTADDCAARGGTVVGDIGDGATQRPDYLCPDGQPPIGTVPVGIEGSVCCGQ